MRIRATITTVAIAALLSIVLLIRSAAQDERVVAFSLDVDPGPPAATLAAGQQACQGPIDVTAPIASVILWLTPLADPGPAATVTVRDYATSAPLATGSVASGYTAATAPSVRLSRTVPQGNTVSICIRSAGPKLVQLIGDVPNSRSGALTAPGHPRKYVLAMLFIRPHPVSLLSQIPTVFRRAALFRPDWVGSWTFWVLTVLLAGTFGAGLYAVVQAERADAPRSNEHTRPQ